QLTAEPREKLGRLALRAWSLKRSLDIHTEISHWFTFPAVLQVGGDTIASRAFSWAERVCRIDAELMGIQSELDERCFALYGIDEADRRAITEGFGAKVAEAESTGDTDEADDEPGDDAEQENSSADARSLAAELVSWTVGIAFGRFDVRLAIGARPMPAEPDPFDP